VNDYGPQEFDPDIDTAVAVRMRLSQRDESPPPDYLSHEMVIDEIDFLFDLLKYGYAAYQYFGGDEVFFAVKNLMLVKLKNLPDPVSNDIYANEILAVLGSVITDNHFMVHNYMLDTLSILYMNDEYVIHKTDEGFLTKIDGRIYKFLRTDYYADMILPTLTEEGELAWMFGFLSGDERRWGWRINVDFEDIATGEVLRRRITLKPVCNNYVADSPNELYTLSNVNGIPVLANRRLITRDEENDPPLLRSFVDTAISVRDEPMLILDLRFHQGGDGNLVVNWFRRYTEIYGVQQSMFARADLQTFTTSTIAAWATASSRVSWHVPTYINPITIANDNFVIVLMDNWNGSAGEYLIGFLRKLENVLFVGTNTSGCLLTAGICEVALPYSKVALSFGTSLHIRPDLSPIEGIGFMPDLWVPPGESLERVLKFIERYGE
jgi:hypothetical protein